MYYRIYIILIICLGSICGHKCFIKKYENTNFLFYLLLSYLLVIVFNCFLLCVGGGYYYPITGIKQSLYWKGLLCIKWTEYKCIIKYETWMGATEREESHAGCCCCKGTLVLAMSDSQTNCSFLMIQIHKAFVNEVKSDTCECMRSNFIMNCNIQWFK